MSARRSVLFILLVMAWIFSAACAEAPEADVASDELDFDRFQMAVEQALAGQKEEALNLGRTLIKAHPADWQGWYLRLLARKLEPLTSEEREELQRTDDERFELLRGLRDYFELSGPERGKMTTTLVERFPESGLAAALNSSNLLILKDTAASLDEARRALTLDPRSVPAAWVELRASQGRPAKRACELAATFHATKVFRRICLERAAEITEAEKRVSALKPLLVSLAGNEELPQTLRIALGNQAKELSNSTREMILGLLQPEDDAWRPEAYTVMNLGFLSAQQGSQAAAVFFERVASSADPLSVDGVELLERSARISSLAWLSAGLAERSAEVARRNVEVLPMHRRSALYERLVEAANASGRDDLRSVGERGLDIVNRPFDAASRNDGRFYKIDPTILTNVQGEEIEIDWSRAATLVVFWRTTCHWSSLELTRLAPRLRELCETEDLDILWLNSDKPYYREAASAEALELKLETTRLFFGDSAANQQLEHDLLVKGTPSFVLVARGGRVVADWVGYREEGWADEIARLVHDAGASRGATLRDRVLDPDGEPAASEP